MMIERLRELIDKGCISHSLGNTEEEKTPLIILCFFLICMILESAKEAMVILQVVIFEEFDDKYISVRSETGNGITHHKQQLLSLVLWGFGTSV